jgi:hypothetical protein
MNEFVNFKKRGIELPPGCKDLGDVLPPPPRVRVPVEGLTHIERYLSRLSQSPAQPRWVFIWSLDSQVCVRVNHIDGALTAMLLVDTRDAAGERAVLTLFRKAGIPPLSDASPEGIPLRRLEYALPASVPDAAALIRALLHRAYGLAEDAGLLFEYHEASAGPQ